MIRRSEIRLSHLTRQLSYWWILAGTIVVYLFSRLLWLNRLPPFFDETLHIWFAILFRSGNLGAGFSEGKWLATILIAPFLSLPGEALWEARLLSVISGLLSTLGLFLIGKTLFTLRVGLLAATLYVIIPYALFYDRLALTDGLAMTFGVWIVFVTILTLDSENGMLSVVLATLLIFSFLTKASTMIFIMIPFLAVLILMPSGQWSRAIKKVLPAIIGSAIVLIALLAGDFAAENLRGKYEFSLGKTLLNSFLANGGVLVDWGWQMLSPILAVTTLLAIGWSVFIDRSRPKWFLLSLLILAIGPYLLIARKLYPRYVFFALVPIILLSSCFISWLLDRLLTITKRRDRFKLWPLGFLILLLAWPLFLDYQILASPESASLPDQIKWQYFEGWPSGYGVRRLAEYLTTTAQDMDGDQLIVVRPVMGGQVYASGLDLYLHNSEEFALSENIVLEAIGADPDVALDRLTEWLGQGHRIVIVADTTNQTGMAIIEQVEPYLKLERIWFSPKPASDLGLTIWEVQ